MANATITFTYGSTTVEVSTPDYPEHPGEYLDQFISRAMGGRVTAITRGSGTIKEPVLVWEELSNSEFTALKDFFFTTTNGAENEVTYTDWDGNVHTVKYLGGLERAEQIDFDSWKVELKLAIV